MVSHRSRRRPRLRPAGWHGWVVVGRRPPAGSRPRPAGGRCGSRHARGHEWPRCLPRPPARPAGVRLRGRGHRRGGSVNWTRAAAWSIGGSRRPACVAGPSDPVPACCLSLPGKGHPHAGRTAGRRGGSGCAQEARQIGVRIQSGAQVQFAVRHPRLPPSSSSHTRVEGSPPADLRIDAREQYILQRFRKPFAIAVHDRAVHAAHEVLQQAVVGVGVGRVHLHAHAPGVPARFTPAACLAGPARRRRAHHGAVRQRHGDGGGSFPELFSISCSRLRHPAPGSRQRGPWSASPAKIGLHGRSGQRRGGR